MKGMPFKPDMRKAIEEGRKTQTRRVIKPQPFNRTLIPLQVTSDTWGWFKDGRKDLPEGRLFKPQYQVGDVVYIKEMWAVDKQFDHLKASEIPEPENVRRYFLDDPLLKYGHAGRWRSPMFMPAWASRYFLKILNVKPEKLQEITISDIEAEGHQPFVYPDGTKELSGAEAFSWYQNLWDSINPKSPWSRNKWVWVNTFVKVDKPQ